MGVLPTRAVELRAAGESSQRRERDSLDELTPQELQIVQMVAQGLTNGVIADGSTSRAVRSSRTCTACFPNSA